MIAIFFCSSPILAQYLEKQHIGAQELLEDSFTLGKTAFESGFRPTFLIAIWRGGASIGIAVEEYFRYQNAPINHHCSVRVSSYNHDQLKKEVVVFDLDYVARTIQATDRLLIVDDVLDSGSSVKKLLEEIDKQCGENAPKDIKIATIYYKPKSSTIPPPDYYLHETSSWLVFPHEFEGLSTPEIKELKGDAVLDIIK
jgi:hypothetical protein